MPEIVADPPSPACYDLLPDADTSHFRDLVLISFASRGTRVDAGSEHARRAGPVV
jgi:hypothetical protein